MMKLEKDKDILDMGDSVSFSMNALLHAFCAGHGNGHVEPSDLKNLEPEFRLWMESIGIEIVEGSTKKVLTVLLGNPMVQRLGGDARIIIFEGESSVMLWGTLAASLHLLALEVDRGVELSWTIEISPFSVKIYR